jgi:hypothetical protein
MKTDLFLLTILAAATALPTIAPAQAQTARTVEDPSDVMHGAMPKFPAFPKLAKKPGHIRGWVKDARGKPLKGARIEIGSTRIGGAKTYVTARSDEKGLYEVELPLGACNVGGAGYVVTLGGMRANLPLHAVDGEVDIFSAQKGDVENFVLLPYGVASPGGASENPTYEFYYYGGSVRLVYWTQSADNPIPKDATIEVTLQPQGPLIDGSKAPVLMIRQPVGETDLNTVNINNIPATTYNISARMIRGGTATPLQMKDRRTARRDGLKPKVTSGTATLIFSPKSGQDGPRTLNYTGWEPIMIDLSLEGAAKSEGTD